MRLLFIFILLNTCFQSLGQKKETYSDFKRGYRHFYYHQWDSAYFYFDRHLQKTNDPVDRANTHTHIAEIQKNTGDLYGAQESIMKALGSLNPRVDSQRSQAAIAYNVLGNISLDLKNYDEAIGFFDTALNHLPSGDHQGSEIINSKTIALQRKGDYNRAIALYDSVLRTPQLFPVRLARLIHNRARTKWLQDKNYNPLPEYYQALKIRLDSNYTLALNASYAHLSEYYEQSNKDSALWYANKRYAVAQQSNSAEDMLEAIDQLMRLHKSPEVKQDMYTRYRRISDSLQAARDTSRNRFALVRYGVEKTKAEKLALQQDYNKQRLVIVVLIILAIVIIAALYTRYNRRRKKIQQEAEKTIRENRFKTSQKVHDVVANGLYGIMNELEHKQQIEREPLLEKIEGLYEQSRNISYEDPATGSAEPGRTVANLLAAFSSEHTKLISVGNNPGFWQQLSPQQQQQLELVLNELLVNMKKHSSARNVVIHFSTQPGKALIHYKDDGIGLPPHHQPGNGLKNTVNRIVGMQGDIIFGKSDKGGLSVHISLPLAHPAL